MKCQRRRIEYNNRRTNQNCYCYTFRFQNNCELYRYRRTRRWLRLFIYQLRSSSTLCRRGVLGRKLCITCRYYYCHILAVTRRNCRADIGSLLYCYIFLLVYCVITWTISNWGSNCHCEKSNLISQLTVVFRFSLWWFTGI